MTIFMIVGFPTETEQEALAGFRKVMELKELGLISEYRYSLFAAYSGSDIREHPGRYGIRRWNYPERHDLCPDVCEFESDGMPRWVARRLFREFWATAYGKIPAVPRYVLVDGKAAPVNFGLREIRSILDEESDQRVIDTLCDWLDSGVQKVRAL